MDKILIKDLEVYAFHGVNQQEKDMGQRFLISLELYLDLREAGVSDDIHKTVSYAKVCQDIDNEFKKNKHNLIEKAAEDTAKYILLNYLTVEKVKVLIKKPWAPIGKPLDYAAVEIERSWHKVFIALGSNLGDKAENMNTALDKINQSSETKVIKVSEFYETKPVGFEKQDNFLNSAAELKTLLTPEELIKFLLQIEKELKRERLIKWGPRTVDLDILLYDNLITSCEDITIPHPRMHERLFVIKPLCDIAPLVLHPLLNKRINMIEQELSKEQRLI